MPRLLLVLRFYNGGAGGGVGSNSSSPTSIGAKGGAIGGAAGIVPSSTTGFINGGIISVSMRGAFGAVGFTGVYPEPPKYRAVRI